MIFENFGKKIWKCNMIPKGEYEKNNGDSKDEEIMQFCQIRYSYQTTDSDNTINPKQNK